MCQPVTLSFPVKNRLHCREKPEPWQTQRKPSFISLLATTCRVCSESFWTRDAEAQLRACIKTQDSHPRGRRCAHTLLSFGRRDFQQGQQSAAQKCVLMSYLCIVPPKPVFKGGYFTLTPDRPSKRSPSPQISHAWLLCFSSSSYLEVKMLQSPYPSAYFKWGLKITQSQPSLLWAGTPPTGQGCPRPYPTRPWTRPGLGHPQHPRATCSTTFTLKTFLSISYLNVPPPFNL